MKKKKDKEDFLKDKKLKEGKKKGISEKNENRKCEKIKLKDIIKIFKKSLFWNFGILDRRIK